MNIHPSWHLKLKVGQEHGTSDAASQSAVIRVQSTLYALEIPQYD